jgi:hypothetical protein
VGKLNDLVVLAPPSLPYPPNLIFVHTDLKWVKIILVYHYLPHSPTFSPKSRVFKGYILEFVIRESRIGGLGHKKTLY